MHQQGSCIFHETLHSVAVSLMVESWLWADPSSNQGKDVEKT